MSHATCEWEPDRAELARVGRLAVPHGTTTFISPPAPSRPLAQGRGGRASQVLGPGGWTLSVQACARVCTRAPGCACLSVCVLSGRGVGRQEREALTGEERIGVWKGVKALERKILAGMLRCPLLASVSSANFFFFPL